MAAQRQRDGGMATERFESLASRAQAFQSRTPQRFRTISRNDVGKFPKYDKPRLTVPRTFSFSTDKRAAKHGGGAAASGGDGDGGAGTKRRRFAEKQKPYRGQLTVPREFKLSTAARGGGGGDSDSTTTNTNTNGGVKTRDEREAELMASMRQFKAHPVNRRVLESTGDLGLQRRPKKPATKQRPFKLSSAKKRAVRHSANISAGGGGGGAAMSTSHLAARHTSATARSNKAAEASLKRQFTAAPISSHAASAGAKRKRRPAARSVAAVAAATRHAPAPPAPSSKKLTVPRSPHFHATRHAAVTDTSTVSALSKRRGKSNNDSDAPSAQQPLTLTQPKPFRLATAAKGAAYEHELRAKMLAQLVAEDAGRRFVAAPVPRTNRAPPPTVDAHATAKPATHPAFVMHHSDLRAMQRAAFDEAQAKRAADAAERAQRARDDAAELEAERVRLLRRRLVHTAQPVRGRGKPAKIKRSARALTVPRSPRLSGSVKKAARGGVSASGGGRGYASDGGVAKKRRAKTAAATTTTTTTRLTQPRPFKLQTDMKGRLYERAARERQRREAAEEAQRHTFHARKYRGAPPPPSSSSQAAAGAHASTRPLTDTVDVVLASDARAAERRAFDARQKAKAATAAAAEQQRLREEQLARRIEASMEAAERAAEVQRRTLTVPKTPAFSKRGRAAMQQQKQQQRTRRAANGGISVHVDSPAQLMANGNFVNRDRNNAGGKRVAFADAENGANKQQQQQRQMRLTEPKPFRLRTEAKGAQYDAAERRVAAERAAAEEAERLAHLIPRANPIRRGGGLAIQPSNRPLTVPKTPSFPSKRFKAALAERKARERAADEARESDIRATKAAAAARSRKYRQRRAALQKQQQQQQQVQQQGGGGGGEYEDEVPSPQQQRQYSIAGREIGGVTMQPAAAAAAMAAFDENVFAHIDIETY